MEDYIQKLSHDKIRIPLGILHQRPPESPYHHLQEADYEPPLA